MDEVLKNYLMYRWVFVILNMSLSATFVAVAVMLIRLPLNKAPKWISCALWGVVLFRLLCPFSFSSPLSLLGGLGAPAAESGVVSYIPENIVHTAYPAVDLVVPGISEVINETLPQGEEQQVADPLEAPAAIGAFLWFFGLSGMLLYSVVSYTLLKRRLREATRVEENVFETDAIKSPFVCGLIKPRIYLPTGLTEQERGYVLLHERAHILRRDYLVKPLFFLALSGHWFNPVIWFSFRLMSRDMELSCDERVARELDFEGRAGYSAALMRLATGRPILAGSPLAFGESGAKDRIKNMLRYKKPAFWIVVAAAVVCVAAAVLLLANPGGLGGETYETGYVSSKVGGTDFDGVYLTLRDLKLDANPTILTVTWHNETADEVNFGDNYWIYRYEDGKWVSCATQRDVSHNDLAFVLSAESGQVKNYYNYFFDLSRTGTYRLETDFFFYKGVPITEDDKYTVWLDFEITDETPAAPGLDFGVYAPAELLYTHPESSGIAETLQGIFVTVEETGFRFVDAESLEERAGYSSLKWYAEAVDPEAWYGLFPSAGVDIGGYASRSEYDIDDTGSFRLYFMDGTLWFAEINNDEIWYLCRLEKTNFSISDVVARTGPVVSQNETLRVDSPNGVYAAEAYGTNTGITAAGLYPYEGLRVIRNSDETTVWSGLGYFTPEFLWSGDSKYVAVYGAARTWGECFLVEAEIGKVIELPNMSTLSAQLGTAAQPDDNRPDPNFKVAEWVNDTTIRVDYHWTAQGYKFVSGTYEYDIASGDIVSNASEISDMPG